MRDRGYKSSERVLDSSSDEESLPSPTRILDAPNRGNKSPSPSSIHSSSPAPSNSSSSKSATPEPSTEHSSYQYTPPTSYELSTSKYKSALPAPRTNDKLFLMRIPRGVNLHDVKFNFRKRKVRIGEEEWNLQDESI